MPPCFSNNAYLLIVISQILSFGIGFGMFAGSPTGNISEIETQAAALSAKWNGELIRRSISFYRQAADLWLENDQPQIATDSLREIVRLDLVLSKPEDALSLLAEISAIDLKNKNFQAEIENLCLKSAISLDLGQMDESEKYLNEAVNLSKRYETKRNRIAVLAASANYRFSKHDNPKALELYDRALALAAETGDEKKIADINYEVCYIHMTNADFAAAEKSGNAALEKYEQIGGERGAALSTLALGTLAWLVDDKRLALKRYERSKALFPGDISFYDRAILLNGFASVYEDYGELELSLKYREQALDSYKLAQNVNGQITTLLRMSNLCLRLNKTDASFEHIQNSEILANRIKDKFFIAISVLEYANFYFKTGDLKTAAEFYDKTLKSLDENIYKHDIAFILNRLGEIKFAEKSFDEASEYFRRASELNVRLNDKMGNSQAFYNFARLDLARRDFDSGLKNIKESLALTESLYSDVANSKLQQTYFSNVYERYELYINLLMSVEKQSSGGEYAVQALQAVERSRARLMLEKLYLSETNIIKDADPEAVRRESEIRSLLNAKTDKLADAVSGGESKDYIERINSEIGELTNELEQIKSELKQNSPDYYAIKNPAPFDVAEFQRTILDENSLLLEFSFGKNESYLWLIGKNEFAAYVLPPREQIEDKIQKLRELLASREMSKDETTESFQTRIARSEKEYALISGELSRDLFGQIADKFGDKKLIVVPDGKLGVFPVAALPLPDSEKNEPILLSNEVVYEPSASTLSLIAKLGRRAKSPSKDLLIFSDPVFTIGDDRLSGEDESENTDGNINSESFRFVESLNSLERLKSSKTEADSIINILGRSNVESFSGFAANRERLIGANASDYRILHFATHGMIDENRPELSGIVLSRFDENGRKRDEFFRLHDIYAMNLNSDLVVLSACNTGVGKEVRGEGLMSLNNAFLSVGAKSVLSSLWKVEDGATLELMKNFYEAAANEHLTPSKALQKAQTKMLESDRWKSPFYWAAFTVQGDFKNVPQISGDSGVWKYFLPMPFVLLFGAFWGFRIIRRRNRM